MSTKNLKKIADKAKKNDFISQRKVNVIVHVILTKFTNYNKNIKQLFRIGINYKNVKSEVLS